MAFRLIGVLMIAGLALASSAVAAETPKTEPMKFARVVADDPSCGSDCPEWIAAQGQIVAGTAAAFQKIVASLGGRRLPILISSPGGSTTDAIAMGRLIRAKKLAVAVARTDVSACTEKIPAACGPARARATVDRAFCASACTMVLAGGIERFAYPLTPIGVHQTLTVFTQTKIYRQYLVHYRILNGVKEEVSRDLMSEKRSQTTSKQAAAPQTESNVASFWREAGIDPQLEQIALSTPPAAMHWLTAPEKTSTRLITAWIDSADPIVVGLGANGLQGVATAAAPNGAPTLLARGEWPFAIAIRGQIYWFGLEVLYRRGGGVVQATVHTKPQGSTQNTDGPGDVRGLGFSLRLPGAELRIAKTFNRKPWRAEIPRADFCKAASVAAWSAEPYDDPANEMPYTAENPHEPPLTVELAKMDGMAALWEEACGPGKRI